MLGWGGILCPNFQTSWDLKFFWQFFFTNIVNIELYFRCKTYGCNKSHNTLIWLTDLVFVCPEFRWTYIAIG